VVIFGGLGQTTSGRLVNKGDMRGAQLTNLCWASSQCLLNTRSIEKLIKIKTKVMSNLIK